MAMIKASNISNILIVEFDSVPDPIELNVTYTGDIKLKPCLVRLACNQCADADSCNDTHFLSNPFDSQDLQMYGTHLQYSCPLAQKFNQTEWVQEMRCQWDGTWSGGSQLAPCIRKYYSDDFTLFEIRKAGNSLSPAYGCANPPQLNVSTTSVVMLNFTRDYVYAFNDSVYYVCEGPKYHFKHDLYLINFTLTCQDNGEWTALPGFECQHEDSKLWILL